MNNFRDFRVAFLHSKFWTHNSLMVPESKVVLNEDFVDWHNLLRIPSQIQHFKVYWFAKGISGEICIPGQWNYAYIDGKFYHLVKTFSNGFIKGVEEEWFYYNVIYDDWQNDWLNNTFYLKGTIELTGDQELVRKHIHQTSPIIENVNGYRFLNGTQATESNAETVLKLPEKIPLSMQLEGMSSVDRLNINRELEAFHARGKLLPDEDKLCLPFMYKVSTSGNWKWNILRGIDRLIREGMQVFDVTVQSMVDAGQAGKFRNILENMLGSDELYLASNSSNRVYSFAKSVNPTKWLSEIDLSGCIDIIVYDRLRLVPLFNVENPEKKFKVGDFVDGLIRRHGWPSDYRNEMIDIFNDVVAPAFAPLLAHEDDWDTKIFRDVGIEKIERKADYWDYEKKVFTDKPI